MPVTISISTDIDSYEICTDTLEKNTKWLLTASKIKDHTVSVVLLDDAQMAGFNKKYRNKDGPTNVLSFPAGDETSQMFPGESLKDLGDILISVETAKREAQNEKKQLARKLDELLIHGFLHLLGHDHERSEKEALAMWDEEKRIYKDMKHRRRKTMTHLAINVDHVATIRQARGITEPDPVLAAGICELAGAAGIVVHLREDRRHIQDRDVYLLRDTIKTKLNLEMAVSKEIIGIALDVKPDMITLVPEKRQELTTEGGLDVIANEKKIRKTVEKMNKAGIPVSLFIDPDAVQIEAAVDTGATFVELHTGCYCDATTEKERDQEFLLIERSAELAFDSGLRVNAGHGLDYLTTARVAALNTIEELSIGHAIITRAVFVGLDQAVREMNEIIMRAN